MRRALLIVAKAPEPGRTKTRLVPPLTPDEAARLYRAFLLDTLAIACQVDWEHVCMVAPRGARSALVELAPPGVHVREQRGEGLGNALRDAFAHHLACGFERVVLIGSDNPTLPARYVNDASMALDRHDLSIGPTSDGGYYLIGMRVPHLGVFDGITWSTSRVYGQTLDRAAALSLRVAELPAWFDVDEPADLINLQRELESASAEVAPRTRAALSHVCAGTFQSAALSPVNTRACQPSGSAPWNQ